MRPHLATFVEDYRRHGTQRAVVVHRGNRRQLSTYADLANLSQRFAAELMRRQIVAGDRVVLWGQNSAEWIAAFFGCVLRGVLVVPLDAAGGLDFAQRVIAETAPRLLAGDEALLARLPTGIPRLTLEDLAAALPFPLPHASLAEPSLGPDTPLQILFTSGTTSEPKGIVHTHGNVLASLDPIEREMQKYLRYERLFHPLRFLHTLPLSHVFGQFMGLWIPPLLAAEVHFETRLQAPRLLELIHRHRISVLAAVPRVLDLLKSHLEQRFPALPSRLDSARDQRIWHRWWKFRDVHRQFGFKFWAFVSGGASLPTPVERFWNDLGFALIQGYGMTETTALITLNHPFHIGQGSIGKPLPGREVRIADDGEILVRGEMVAAARWQNGRMNTLPDPWLATGDLVEQDGDGQLRFLGRKSETIVTAAGLNVHPEDVEAALNRQPGVAAAAVVPLDTATGTVPAAALIFRGTPEQAQSAIDAANASLAEYQRVYRWKLWPQLDFPRTAIGKIQRRTIAQWIAAQLADPDQLNAHGIDVQGNVPGGSIESGEVSLAAPDPMSALIAAVTRAQPSTLHDNARLDRDLHLDSLARVQLQTELEQRLGVTLGDEEFEQLATLGQLRARLGFAPSPGGPHPSVGGPHPPAVGECGNAENPAASPLPSALGESTSSPSEAQREPLRFLYPRWPWWPAVQAIRVLFQEAVMRPLIWLLAAPAVTRESEQRLPEQPLLLIANHVTAFDAPLVLYALPAAVRRRVAIATAGEMLVDWRHARHQRNWLLNLLAPFEYWLVTALFNVFPLPRSAGFRRSFAHAGEAMDHGYHVLVFPEGQMSPDGSLLPFRAGIGLLARESKARILPVALQGLGELKQRKRRWFRSHTLQIRVGKTIEPATQLAPEELAELLHHALAGLLQRER